MGSPFEITVFLSSPLALPSGRTGPNGAFPIMLDSLLIDLAARRILGDAYGDGWPDRLRDIPIPLDMAELPGGHRCYRASAGVLVGPRKVMQEAMPRRWRSGLDMYARTGKSRAVGTGVLRDWKVPFRIVSVRAVRFWARGDRGAVRELLSGLTHLGFRRAAGYGKVARIVIRDMDTDFSLFGPGGAPARPMPAAAAFAAAAAMGGRPELGTPDYARCEPPYWRPDGRRFAILPPVVWWMPVEEVGGDDAWLLS